MVGDNKALTARCRWNGTSSVPAECQNSDNCVGNGCGSHGVCRVKATSTVVHLNEYNSECDSGFDLKFTARVAANQLLSTMLITCPQMPLSLRKLSPTSVVCSACRVSSVTAESRKRNLQNDIRGQTARALRNESNQTSENTFYCQHQLSRRHCIQQNAARSGAQVANATRTGVRGGAREVDGPNTDVGLHSGTVLVRHAG